MPILFGSRSKAGAFLLSVLDAQKYKVGHAA